MGIRGHESGVGSGAAGWNGRGRTRGADGDGSGWWEDGSLGYATIVEERFLESCNFLTKSDVL